MKYVDMHCDTITLLKRKIDEGQNVSLRNNDLHISLEKMVKGDALLQNFAIFTYLPEVPNPRKYVKEHIAFYYDQLSKNKELIRPVFCYEDIETNIKNSVMSSLLTLEEGAVIDNDLNNLNDYYKDGVRMIALTWNFPNGIGYPNVNPTTSMYHTETEKGLTDFGIEYIKRMEELGIIIDVSHLGDKGFYDVYNNTTAPFVASHSNARSVSGVSRNLTDDMIKKISERRGVIGINYCAPFIDDQRKDYTYIKDIIKHIKYIVNIGGIDVVALGGDMDGISNELEFKDCSGIQMLYKELQKEFSEEDIEKIFYKNTLRVYKEVLK